MTGMTPHPSPATRDRSLPLLAAAAVLVLAVVGAVLLIAVERPPALVSLTDEPAPVPPGAVAWTAWQEGGPCLWIAEPDGEVRELNCGEVGDQLDRWTEEGIVVRDWSEGDERRQTIDPSTGALVSREASPPDPSQLDDGPGAAEDVRVEREDGRLRVVLTDESSGQDIVLWDTEAPASYGLSSFTASPDGRFIVFGDDADRLIVVPADGSAPPRVWAEDVPAYVELVWEPNGEAREPVT